MKFRTLGSITVLFVLIVLLFTSVSAKPNKPYPDLIPLGTGFQPEGITDGNGAVAYVGALNGGKIFEVNLRSGVVSELVPASDRIAVGLDFDPRSNLLFVAGGLGGAAYVYDATSGIEVAVCDVTVNGQAGFVNDVFITRDAAYLTDSLQPYYFKIPLGPAGSLPADCTAEPIQLTGEFDFAPSPPGQLVVNANGIVATPNGDRLIIVNSAFGNLYSVKAGSGDAVRIPVSGSPDTADVESGDGLLLLGHKLYVVQNFLNKVGIVELSPDYASGEYVGAITSADFRIPTTVAMHGSSLYLPNARFDEVPPLNPGPDDDFEIVRVDRNK